MKAFGIIVAAIVGVVAVPAAAYQPARTAFATSVAPAAQVVERHDDRDHWDRGRDWRRDRDRDWRRDRHDWDRRDWNRGRHNGWRNNWRWRTDCHTQWRDGRRERVCRHLRYR